MQPPEEGITRQHRLTNASASSLILNTSPMAHVMMLQEVGWDQLRARIALLFCAGLQIYPTLSSRDLFANVGH